MQQKPAQLFKAAFRGNEETENYRKVSVFNFGNYQEESRKPFGNLTVLNDETLAPGVEIAMLVEENMEILILPLVGGIDFKGNNNEESFVRTGHLQVFSAAKNHSFTLTNPYEDDLVNYLHIWISNTTTDFKPKSQRIDFDFTRHNVLHPLYSNAEMNCEIGIFDGRKEGIYTLKNPKNGLFVFVLNGAFEFENRLIESRDGLALSEITSAEFEALSENAMLLLLEIPF